MALRYKVHKDDSKAWSSQLEQMLEGEPPFSHMEPYEAAKYVAEGHRPSCRAKGYIPELRE